MSRQINLYDPGLRRQRKLLTLTNLCLAGGVLLAAVGAWGLQERERLATVQAETQALEPRLKAAQSGIAEIGKKLAEAKPDPRFEADLKAARALLSLRGEIVETLQKGVGPQALSFAEHMRAFSRQASNGLWLTGFSIADGGAMEIRGRMTDSGTLPEYIRRLNGEKAFQGRAFAALKIETPKPEGGASASTTRRPATRAAFMEFSLTPVEGPARPRASGEEPTRVASAPEAASLSGEIGRTLVDAGKAALGGRQ